MSISSRPTQRACFICDDDVRAKFVCVECNRCFRHWIVDEYITALEFSGGTYRSSFLTFLIEN